LEKVERQLGAWKNTGKMNAIILGVDLNFTLPGELAPITGKVVETRAVKHPDRLHEIIRFLSEFKLRATNTFGTQEATSSSRITWHNKSFSQRTQIDYIFMSDNMDAEASARTDTGLESDHYPFGGDFQVESADILPEEEKLQLERLDFGIRSRSLSW
jgi:hypothetical protein